MEFFEQLEEFLKQAKTDNLKTKHFVSNYLDTKVKVSFGQGNAARIPWISFLLEPNTTSKGIYPVYLYYKDQDILILAYGVSETNEPEINWNINDKLTINEFFKKTYNHKPDRYGSSFIYKVYDLKEKLNRSEVENDLKNIIHEYKNIKSEVPIEMENSSTNQVKFNALNFNESCKKAGLLYSDLIITRFISSLLTKPFVILTGLSGSGKTKLAQAFVEWISQEKSQYEIIPVGADWTNREPLLGYPNALKPDEYVKPDNGVLDLILKAIDNPELPFFLILDEMNLSHVERYFADFLSVMESDQEIPLHQGSEVENGVPTKLKIPSNFFIIGTVNIDETTNMFSPKVLDRANTIEFRVSKEEMVTFLSNIKDLGMSALYSKGANMSKDFLTMAQKKSFDTKDREKINGALIEFFEELAKTGAEFGYRSAREILRLIYQLSEIDSTLTTNEKIDIAIMQKLLPKLHGSRRKLTPVLETLGSFCVSDQNNIVKEVFEKSDYDYKDGKNKFPLSLEKIARMYKGAIENGFASYAEA